MTAPERSGRAEGVGLAYHPFLHDALLAHIDAFDFIDLPLDLYADPARSNMLDPEDARLRELAAAIPCTWSSSTLSLGSVEAGHDPAPPAWLLARTLALMERVGAPYLTEVIGFRRSGGRDLGSAQDMPCTEAAAGWVATRQQAAVAALGRPVRLRFAPSTLPAPPTAWDAGTFLDRVAARAGCGLVLDVADAARLAAARRLPGSHVATLAIAAEREEDWATLATLIGQTAATSVVIQRDRALFPMNAIAQDARRARAILAQQAGPAPKPLASLQPDAADGGLAALHAYQDAVVGYLSDPAPADMPHALAHVPAAALGAMAMRVQTWQNWRLQVDDTFKAHQIGQFLARDAHRRREAP